MKAVRKALLISLFGNIFLILIKVTTGIMTNTMMLIANGIHSFSDLLTDIISLLGQKLSEKGPDKKHPVGYGEIQYATSLVMGIVVVYFAASLIAEAITSKGNTIDNRIIPIIVITLIIKSIIVRYIYKKGKKYNNSILMASVIESRADELSSIGILLTALLSNLSLLIGECETNEKLLNSIREIIRKDKEVKRINGLMLIKSGYYYNASIRISVDKNLTIKKAHKIANRVKSKILNSKYNIKYVTMSVNPYEENK